MDRERATELATSRALELMRNSNWPYWKAVEYGARLFQVDVSEVKAEMMRRRRLKEERRKREAGQLSLDI